MSAAQLAFRAKLQEEQRQREEEQLRQLRFAKEREAKRRRRVEDLRRLSEQYKARTGIVGGNAAISESLIKMYRQWTRENPDPDAMIKTEVAPGVALVNQNPYVPSSENIQTMLPYSVNVRQRVPLLNEDGDEVKLSRTMERIWNNHVYFSNVNDIYYILSEKLLKRERQRQEAEERKRDESTKGEQIEIESYPPLAAVRVSDKGKEEEREMTKLLRLATAPDPFGGGSNPRWTTGVPPTWFKPVQPATLPKKKSKTA